MKSSTKFFRTFLFSCMVFSAPLCTHAQENTSPPKVLATIAPLHSLVAGVMEGVAVPELLLNGTASPHDYSLTPLDAKHIAGAHMIVLTDKKAERYAMPIIEAFPERKQNIIVASQLPGLALYYIGIEDHNEVDPKEQKEKHHNIDMHLWLDPQNAIRITREVADRLSALDPERKVIYQRNAVKQTKLITALDQQLTAALNNAKGMQARYALYHGSLQYFEKRYRITPGSIITRTPESGPALQEAAALEQAIQNGSVSCLFQEPEFTPALLQNLAAKYPNQVKLYTLDGMGSLLPKDKDLYIKTMQQIAATIKACSVSTIN